MFHDEEDVLWGVGILRFWNDDVDELWNEHWDSVGADLVCTSDQLDLSDNFDAIILELVEIRDKLDSDVPPGLLAEALIDLSEASLANFVDYVVLDEDVDPFVSEPILLLTFLSDRPLELEMIITRYVRSGSFLGNEVISEEAWRVRRLIFIIVQLASTSQLLRELVHRPDILIFFVLSQLSDLDTLVLEHFEIGCWFGMLVH